MNGSGSDGSRALLETVLWRRLDRFGAESCRLLQDGAGFRLEGTVLVLDESGPIEARYEVVCDGGWATQTARVELARGPDTSTVELRRDAQDRWWRGDDPVDALACTTDVDLGFTPSTNTLPIRRLSLDVGASAEISAAWVRFPGLELEVLPQRYTRLTAARYLYESAGGRFMAELEVDPLGLVARYGDIWQRVGSWRPGDD